MITSEQQKCNCSIFTRTQDITKTWIFGTAHVTTDTVQIIDNIFPFSGMNFQDNFLKIWVLDAILRKIGKFTFFEKTGIPF